MVCLKLRGRLDFLPSPNDRSGMPLSNITSVKAAWSWVSISDPGRQSQDNLFHING